MFRGKKKLTVYCTYMLLTGMAKIFASKEGDSNGKIDQEYWIEWLLMELTR